MIPPRPPVSKNLALPGEGGVGAGRRGEKTRPDLPGLLRTPLGQMIYPLRQIAAQVASWRAGGHAQQFTTKRAYRGKRRDIHLRSVPGQATP